MPCIGAIRANERGNLGTPKVAVTGREALVDAHEMLSGDAAEVVGLSGRRVSLSGVSGPEHRLSGLRLGKLGRWLLLHASHPETFFPLVVQFPERSAQSAALRS